MGPCEAECPERILRLLTPTTYEYAIAWRRRCDDNLQLRARPIVDGMRIKLPAPITFTNGYTRRRLHRQQARRRDHPAPDRWPWQLLHPPSAPEGLDSRHDDDRASHRVRSVPGLTGRRSSSRARRGGGAWFGATMRRTSTGAHPMIFDVATRHRLALDPAELTSISATLVAMMRAIEDCRNAGVAPDSDPAVVLLARHMATISTNRAPRAVLQGACRRKLADIARFPALLALAARGVEYDSIAKDRFHSEGRAALSALAYALDLDVRSYELTTILGERSDSGCLRLATRHFVVLLRIGGAYQHREVLYRAVRDGREIAPNHHAPIRALLDPHRFAQRLHEDLAIASRAGVPGNRPPPATQAATSSISQEPDHACHRILADGRRSSTRSRSLQRSRLYRGDRGAALRPRRQPRVSPLHPERLNPRCR